MFALLITIIIALFCGMLFLNIYFRVKVFQSYKVLVQNRIEFGAAHVFNRAKLEEEIIARYPNHRKEIVTFVEHMRYSIRMASVLIFLITAFGAVLMYFR